MELSQNTIIVIIVGAGLMAASVLGITSAGPDAPEDIFLVGPREPILEDIVATQEALEETHRPDPVVPAITPEISAGPGVTDVLAEADVPSLDSASINETTSAAPAPLPASDDANEEMEDDGGGD